MTEFDLDKTIPMADTTGEPIRAVPFADEFDLEDTAPVVDESIGEMLVGNLKSAAVETGEKVMKALNVIRWPFWRFIEHPVSTVVTAMQEPKGKTVTGTLGRAVQAYVPFRKIPKEEYGSYAQIWDKYFQSARALAGQPKMETPSWYIAMASYGTAMGVEPPVIKAVAAVAETALTRVAEPWEADIIRKAFEPMKSSLEAAGVKASKLHAEGNIIRVSENSEVFLNKYVSAVLKGGEIRVPKWAKIKALPEVVAEVDKALVVTKSAKIMPVTGKEIVLPPPTMAPAQKAPAAGAEVAKTPIVEPPTADISSQAGKLHKEQTPQISQPQSSQLQKEGKSVSLPLVESMPQETDPVKKIIEALKGAKSVRGQQETLYKKARAQKLAKMMAVGEKVKGEKGFYAEKGSLKGELPKVEFESIRNKLTQEDIDSLFIMVKDTPHISEWDKLIAREGLANLLGVTGGRVPTPSQLKLLHRVFGKELTEALLDKRSALEKITEAGLQIVNIPRSIMASYDLSFGLRQGAFAAPRYRREFFSSFQKQFGWFGSEKAYQENQKLISENPNYELAVESGISFTEMDSLMVEREERFMSQWAEKIPLVGIGIRASGRAYTAFANKFRMDIFSSMVQDAEKLGLNPQENMDLTKHIATLVNSATGRGDLGKFEDAAVFLNSFFFSPRLMASRISLLTKLINPSFYTNESPFVRKEYLKMLLTFLGTGLTILGLAKASGLIDEIGDDIRSSDFGKMKKGITRIDIWAGFQPYVRMVGQLISGEYVSSTTGRILTLGEGYKPLTRLDILMRQIESKESPAVSLITTLLKGQDFQGKKINLSKELALRFVPMVIQDLYDILKDNPEAAPWVIGAPFGVGIQTYKNKQNKKF